MGKQLIPARPLPRIVDLYSNEELAQKQNELAVLLNQQPKPQWIRQHPSVKKEVIINGVKTSAPADYLPIGIVEFLLTAIFTRWRVEVKDAKLVANSIVVQVRLHYLDPISGEWEWQDGIGASPLQTDKGAGAIEFDKIKSGAVMIAAPAAESYAVKDAAEKLGKLFGKDLNRKDELGYDGLLSRFDRDEQLKDKLDD